MKASLPVGTFQIAFVEDEQDYREMLAFWLGQRYTLTCFETPVKFLESLKSGVHFDLLISDLNMPQMSGLDLISHVRADPSMRNIPAIALTALVLDGEFIRTSLGGFNLCLSKLIGFDELDARIDALLSGPACDRKP